MSLKSMIKGVLGEGVVRFSNFIALDKKVYHRLNNITLPLENGGTTQIDHIIVSKFGIFVIETKNYSGWIFGDEKQAQWTQVLQAGKQFKFQNPLRQNYLHVKTLQRLLNLEERHFHSMVVFVGNSELKTEEKLPKNVMNKGWVRYIESKNTMLLDDQKVRVIIEKIESTRFSKSMRTSAKHKAYLKNKARTENETKTESGTSLPNCPKCPKCQSPMVKRVAKNGKYAGSQFWGCSTFPTCRGVLKI